MGWWAPTIFGGDPPLDSLGNLKEAIGIEIAEEDDQGYGDPDSWNERACAAWAAKAPEVEAWCIRRVEEERDLTLASGRDWLILMTLLLDKPVDRQFGDADAVQALADKLDRCAKGFRLLMKDEQQGADIQMACTAVREALEQDRVPDGPSVRMAVSLYAMAALGNRSGWSAVCGALSLAGGDVADLPASCWQRDFCTRLAESLPPLVNAVQTAQDTLATAAPALTDDSAIDVQVATSVIMGCGQPLSERMRDLALKSVLCDPWEDSADRAAVLAEFSRGVRAYSDTKWTQRNRGLFEAFEMAAEEGRGRPINVGPGSKS